MMSLAATWWVGGDPACDAAGGGACEPPAQLMSMQSMGEREHVHPAPQSRCGRYTTLNARPLETPLLYQHLPSGAVLGKTRGTLSLRVGVSNRVAWQQEAEKQSEGRRESDPAVGQVRSCAVPVTGCVLLEGHMTAPRLTLLGYKKGVTVPTLDCGHRTAQLQGAPFTLCSRQKVLPEVARCSLCAAVQAAPQDSRAPEHSRNAVRNGCYHRCDS